MSIKSYLQKVWNDDISEHVNRKAQKQILKANRLFHKGGFWNMLHALYLHNRNIRKYGCEIYPQATIGKNMYMPHCVGIVIGNTAIIGDNCTIYPNVVFGAKYSPGKFNSSGRRHAKVGDNCVFGANSTIIGDITIGNNVTIGAGAVITKDVPDNAIIIGNNKILSK